MDLRGPFGIEAMQTGGVLVDKGIVLGNKGPSDLYISRYSVNDVSLTIFDEGNQVTPVSGCRGQGVDLIPGD